MQWIDLCQMPDSLKRLMFICIYEMLTLASRATNFMLHNHVKHFLTIVTDSQGPLHSDDFSTELFWSVSLFFINYFGAFPLWSDLQLEHLILKWCKKFWACLAAQAILIYTSSTFYFMHYLSFLNHKVVRNKSIYQTFPNNQQACFLFHLFHALLLINI